MDALEDSVQKRLEDESSTILRNARINPETAFSFITSGAMNLAKIELGLDSNTKREPRVDALALKHYDSLRERYMSSSSDRLYY